MTATAGQDTLEERLTAFEHRIVQRLIAVEEAVSGIDARLGYAEQRGARTAPVSSLRVVAHPPPRIARPQAGGPTGASTGRPRSTFRSGVSAADVLGGRVLAWLGGVATVLGIVLFLVLAISHGWIGQEARVVLAAIASAALMAAGAWLREHRGRTEAALIMVGTATVGMFSTLIVASDVYRLVPDMVGVVGAVLVGGLASGLAIRWAARAIGGLGLLGALVSGVLVGAPADITTLAIMAVAGACSMWVVVWQRWGWLALGTVVICAPQWATWILSGQAAPLDVVLLVWFTALGLVGGVAAQLRSGEERLAPVPAVVIALSACLVAVVGRVALADSAGAAAGDLWLAAVACAHLTAGIWHGRRTRISLPTRRLLIVIGVVVADVAIGLSVPGVGLAIGWTWMAVAFAWRARSAADDPAEQTLLSLGIGAHIALALIRILLEAPPSYLGTGQTAIPALLSIAALAAGCIACGQLSGADRTRRRILLDSLGLIAIAYLTAATLEGAAVAAAWALEGLALALASNRTGDRVSRRGALAFIGAAGLHALIVDAPPLALATGVEDLGAAALALGALAAVALRVGLAQAAGTERRCWWLIGAAGCALYLASVAIVSVFQPTSVAATEVVLELTVRQQGQVLLSALWSVTGLVALIVGLRRSVASARTAGLALLLLAVGKVFLYDLSTLTSIYRVASFIVLGLLLLAGAFAYQRLRPPPLPDMRAAPASQP